MQIDVCNGDADGLCSVVQWRLHRPRSVTGLKNDIALLDAHIDTASDTCTSLLVDQQLVGAFRAWAVVGAFGDNLTRVADSLATRLGLSYGESEKDVHITPAHLYEILVHYPDPLNLLEQETVGQELEALRHDDMCQAQSLPAYLQGAHFSVHVFPNAPWSRRISGCCSNRLASAQPLQARALLTSTASADYKVACVRRCVHPAGQLSFVAAFGGDGRAVAAGIDHLPADQLDRFVAAFSVAHWGAPVAPVNS